MSFSTTTEPVYTYETCAHLTIPTVAITVIISIVTFIVSSIGYYRMVKFNKTNTFSTSIYRAQNMFYIMCMIYSISSIPDIIAECWFTFSFFKTITYILGITTYYFHWLSLLLILYLRMHRVFHTTSLQISKCCNIASLSILIGSIPCGIVLVVLAFLIWFDLGMLLMAFNLFILIVFSQYLTITFVRKLYQVNKTQKENISSSPDTKTNVVINVMTKYTILAIMTLIPSTLTFLVLLYVSVFLVFYNPEIYLLVLVTQMIDVLVDSISVSLSMKFNDKYYNILCGKMDNKCKLCCYSIASGGKHVVQLASNMSSTKDAQSTTSKSADIVVKSAIESTETTTQHTATV